MVATGREHLDPVIDNAHDGDVERAAAEVEYENGVVLIQFVETVSERARSRFVDNLENVQTGELPGRDGGGAVRVVEIGRHRDDRISDWLFEIFLGIALQLLDDQRRKFFRGVDFAIEIAVELLLWFAHFALYEIDNFLRVGDRIIFRHRPDDYIRAIKENNRRRDPLGLGVRDNLRFSVSIDMRHGRESRAQINSDYFAFAHDLKNLITPRVWRALPSAVF